MEKRILDITVHGLHDDYLTHAHCSLLIGDDRLAFLITDPSNKILAVKSWQLQTNGLPAARYLDQICENDPVLKNRFASTTIGIQNGLHTIVPNRMFDPTRLPAYFNLLTAHVQRHYQFDSLDFADSKLIFALDSDLKELIDRRFAGARILHSMTSLVEVARSLSNASTYNVFANIYHHTVQVIVFDGQDLLFFNTYQFGSASDFVYFVLLPLKQLQIDPLQVSVVVSGEVTEESDVVTILRRFTGPVRFTQLPHMFDYPGAVQSLPSHFCHDLYSLKLTK
jgi:Protein of unknown function (DUF3822)